MENLIELAHLRLHAKYQTSVVSRQLAVLKGRYPFLPELVTYAGVAAQARFAAQVVALLAEEPRPDAILGAALRAAVRGLKEGQRALALGQKRGHGRAHAKRI
jgi:hypothetical protein